MCVCAHVCVRAYICMVWCVWCVWCMCVCGCVCVGGWGECESANGFSADVNIWHHTIMVHYHLLSFPTFSSLFFRHELLSCPCSLWSAPCLLLLMHHTNLLYYFYSCKKRSPDIAVSCEAACQQVSNHGPTGGAPNMAGCAAGSAATPTKYPLRPVTDSSGNF